MKKYPLIDLAKLYCAILVVLIHALEIPEGHYGANLLKYSLSSQAVPFFLIVSGFFFKKKWNVAENQTSFALGYCKHFLVFYAVWVLICTPEILIQYLSKYPDSSFVYLATLIFRRVVFAGQGVFWYLLVTAEAALIVGFLLKSRKMWLLYLLAGIGAVLDLIYFTQTSLPGLRTINQLTYTVFSWNNNFIMKGLPYMAIGVYFADNYEKWSLKNKPLIAAYLAVFLVHVIIFVGLSSVAENPGRYALLYPIQAVLLFLIAVSAERVNIPERIARESRLISSAIYCLHCFVIYYVINPTIGMNANTFLRIVIAVAVSIGVYWVVKKTECKPLIRLLTLK